MDDWRQRLRSIFQDRERDRAAARVPRERRPAGDYIPRVVVPAFAALKEEMERYGRNVYLQDDENQASITVTFQGEEEFTYLIRLRAFHKMSFAFPEIVEEEDEATTSYTAEVVVHDELQEKRDPDKFTESEIIADFLDHYAKWAGW
jgi:choline/glycine/proline betaine transport protein